MDFLNRHDELERLDGLVARGRGFAVVYGRRRIGKTRLLTEWVGRHGGTYAVADQSAAEVQRRYFAEAVGTRLPGFSAVEYRDWRGLFDRLARDATLAGWRGPLVIDELPYLVQASPDLPAILQRWLDHDARELVVVVAGSSQHMMQGLILDASAPLYGRASEILHLAPLDPRHLRDALGTSVGRTLVDAYAAWGGIPRYWELAAAMSGSVERRIDRLVLDPLGPLHLEPDRLIAEEMPPANEVRPLLDAIGGGAHRLSEIAGRLGRPATSLSRPMHRLQTLGLVHREVPFGDDERSGKRSLYRIADPFTRLWFRVVAPYRALLTTTTPEGRLAHFRRFWPQLVGEAWEELCRLRVPRLGPWGPASRWWRGNAPEWDIVAASLDGRRVLLGEAKLRASRGAMAELERRAPPPELGNVEVVRVMFAVERGDVEGSRVVDAEEVLG